MNWFTQLDRDTQLTIVSGTTLVLIVLIFNLRILFQRPSRLSVHTTEKAADPDPFWEMASRVFEKSINENSPRPWGKKEEGPKLTVTRYYVRRGDGLFYDSTNYGAGDFKPKNEAAWWACPHEAWKVRDCLAAADLGIKYQVINDEVTA